MVNHARVAGNADMVLPPASSTPPLVLLPPGGQFIIALQVGHLGHKERKLPSADPETRDWNTKMLLCSWMALVTHVLFSSYSGTARSEVSSSQSLEGPGRQYKREITAKTVASGLKGQPLPSPS